MPKRREFLTSLGSMGLMAAQPNGAAPSFGGEKSKWHQDFDRHDFILDDATGVITAIPTPAQEVISRGVDRKVVDGKRRCVVVTPKAPARGLPWSWRGCYWNHEPQREIELLARGFHICYVAPDRVKPAATADIFYRWLTEKHGLAKKPAFIGMSQGGANEFNWAVAHPDKAACIYADNPALHPEDLARVPELAKHGVPLLHICGSEDALLEAHTLMVEKIYHQWGGAITVMIKEGQAHHPHSLRNPKFIADWIEQRMEPRTTNRPAFVNGNFRKSSWYRLEPSFVPLKEEGTYATCRGPGFTPTYDRYDATTRFPYRIDGMAIIVPHTIAPGKPWLLQADAADRNAEIDFALLAQGFHVVIAPNVTLNGMVEERWNQTYQLMADHGFAKRPALAGTGARAGEAYAWAARHPGQVACIYARNPLMRSLMSKIPPIENLAPLARAGVPVMHDCGSAHPWLDSETRAVERRYQELGGKMTVLLRDGEGHFASGRRDPREAVEFILRHTGR